MSGEMKLFAKTYRFRHVTSSPHYPKANGLAERSVRTVKSIFTKSTDNYMGLLSYRATPLPWCGSSPAELLMGRRLRTNVPQIDQMFVPDWSHLKEFEERDRIFKAKQKEDYNRRHWVRDVSPIPVDTPVWINTRGTQTPGRVSRLDEAPRSYWLQTPSGEVRRNRRDVIVQAGRDVTVQAETTESQGQQAETTESQGPLEESQGHPPLPARAIETSTRTIATRSRTGTIVKAPERLTY